MRLTIFTSYGNWKYFTLSQVKVYGEGLFMHALENVMKDKYVVNDQRLIRNSN